MSRKVAQVEEDVRRIKMFFSHPSIDEKIMPDVYLGDTRDLSDIKFRKKPTIIITSPPYANRYDYTRTYSLELPFVSYDTWFMIGIGDVHEPGRIETVGEQIGQATVYQ